MSEVSGRDFGRVEGKLDLVLANLVAHAADDTAWHQQIDARLQKLESGHSFHRGRNSIFAAIGGIFAGGIGAILGRYFPGVP